MVIPELKTVGARTQAGNGDRTCCQMYAPSLLVFVKIISISVVKFHEGHPQRASMQSAYLVLCFRYQFCIKII